jgi:hypothetical protein
MRMRAGLLALIVGLGLSGAARSTEGSDCFTTTDNDARLKACTEMIETPGIPPEILSHAYAMRALALSLQGRLEPAIRDYDVAIRLVPEFPVALNNRAWAYFRWGKLIEARVDVEASLRLDPTSPHALDTRAHVSQWEGRVDPAVRDYEQAMFFGGERMVKMYQCGLKAARVYDGPEDGLMTAEVKRSLRICVEMGSQCDPLPPDEDCRQPTS